MLAPVPAPEREGAPLGLERREEPPPGRIREPLPRPEQEIVELLGVARLRASLLAHAGDRLGVEPREVALLDRQAAAHAHGAGAALFEGRVVEVREGRPFRISWASGDGSVVSTQWVARSPDSRRATSFARPAASRASVRQSWSVWRTSGWSGISIGPATFSWQAAAWGKTAAIRSSASMRWIAGGFFLPPRKRRIASARERFQRHRAVKIGVGRDRLAERVLEAGGREEMRDVGERGSCGAGRARGPSRRRSPPPAARS
jgi:hypothetical protein